MSFSVIHWLLLSFSVVDSSPKEFPAVPWGTLVILEYLCVGLQ